MYTGEWHQSKLHGHGNYTWPDGTKYIGMFSNNKKEGRGTITWPDG